MLNNISNFFNLITGKRVKKTLAPNDMIAIGVRNPVTQSDFQPAAIFFKDLEAQIAAGVAPNLQTVVNTGNAITNFGGIGTASISSINFTNNRALYLNTNANPTIRIVDNLNAANNLQIDLDTLALDGVSYNWSSIVNQLPAWLEYNATDKTIWNNGQGNIVSNTSYGDGSLRINTTGANNTGIGINTLRLNLTGSGNTAIGAEALGSSTGANNTAIGGRALTALTTGTNNTAIGVRAEVSSSTISGSIIIGHAATSTSNNQFVVGSSTTNAGAVVVGVNTSTKYWDVIINGVAERILLA